MMTTTMRALTALVLVALLLLSVLSATAVVAEDAPTAPQHSRPLASEDTGVDTLSALRGYLDARAKVEEMSFDGWGTIGMLGGFFGGPIGIGVVWGAAATSSTEVPVSSLHDSKFQSDEYLEGYLRSYSEGVRRNRKVKAVYGGLVGTIFLLAILVTIER